jgi:glycosyltransferase involved in cell wall biosynthesis
LRIIHCIYDDPSNPWVGGGGAVRVLELYQSLQTRVNATVVTGSFPGATDEVRHGVQYWRRGAPAPYMLSRATYAVAASRLLRAEKYDAAVFDFSAYTPIVLPKSGPIGITVHHLTGPTARARWGVVVGTVLARVERRLLRRAHVFSATSQATRDELCHLLSPSAKVVDVGAGVDDRLFELVRREQDYLLYFGRLDWFQKGLDILLQSFAYLVRDFPDLELKIAGRGRDVEKVKTAARELGIQHNLTLLREVSDEEKLALFAGAKLLLMPSRFEGFGMVAAEAMAAGVPIVAAASGSLPEVLAPPAGGRLVPAGDPRELARATADLLSSGEARQGLSRSARVAAERFRWSVVAEQHMTFLHEIAAQD